MVNYQDGKIYKIVCNETGLIYIGSTAQKTLAQRLTGHVRDYKTYLNGKTNYVTSYQILKEGNYEIILIKDFPCESKDKLHAEERKFIEEFDCVNKYIPTRTHKEYCKKYYENNIAKAKEYQKKYREENKDKIKEQQNKYYEANIDKIKEKHKNYYEANTDEIIEKKKKYREANIDKIREQKKHYYQKRKLENENKNIC
jgi:hypothetical protein